MAGLINRLRGAVSALRLPASTAEVAPGDEDVVDMLGVIGAALLAGSQATNDVQHTLEELAARYGRADIRVFVLPTLVLVEDPSATAGRTEIFPVGTDQLRLDQGSEVEKAVGEAHRSRSAPSQVIDTIRAAEQTPPRFGAVLSVFGYTLLTVGFGLVLNPTVTALPVYVVLGLLVGIAVRVGSRFATLSLVLPVVISLAITVFVGWWIRPVVAEETVRLIAPALMSFLPGLTLTVAAVELTNGQVMAGATRLSYGFARLGMLAFGVFAGLSIAPSQSTEHVSTAQLGWWAPWVGTVLVGAGYYFFSAAPRRSLPWIVYALVVAYAAQTLGNLVLGASLSALVGAMAVAPAAYVARSLPGAPSASVMMTCAYWLLVPGALGFMSVSEVASGAGDGTSLLVQTLVSILAIAIGMVVGAGLTHDAVAARRGWQEATPPTRRKRSLFGFRSGKHGGVPDADASHGRRRSSGT